MKKKVRFDIETMSKPRRHRKCDVNIRRQFFVVFRTGQIWVEPSEKLTGTLQVDSTLNQGFLSKFLRFNNYGKSFTVPLFTRAAGRDRRVVASLEQSATCA